MARSLLSPLARRLWTVWLALTVVSAGGLGATMALPKSAARAIFVPGQTSDGHYQIELDCGACHTSAFASSADLENACVSCHAEELAEAKDSHPKSKFTDPRNAKRIAALDARTCLTCHIEHAPARTSVMGLSLPTDYCYRCHQDIEKERPSHEGLAFDSCAQTGCHNYHDNRAIYEDFLVKHAGEAPVLSEPLRSSVAAGPCPSPTRSNLTEQTDIEPCRSCHERQMQGFSASRHGMRAARGLSPMRPGLARRPMKGEASDLQLSCASCHAKSEADPLFASVRACQGCHDDEHTRGYEKSSHYELTLRATRGEVAQASAVTCATCHMPDSEDDSGLAYTNHNQNSTLRPAEKMIRSSCSSCHGLSFSVDALADANLVKNNFSGQPSSHVVSIEWALKRAQ